MATPDIIPPMTPEMPPPPREDIPTREPDEREVPDKPDRPSETEDVPSDVEPGSDADIDRGGAEAEEPSPGDVQTASWYRAVD